MKNRKTTHMTGYDMLDMIIGAFAVFTMTNDITMMVSCIGG